MDKPSENEGVCISCHVTCGDRKAVVSARAGNLLQAISDTFGIGNTYFRLQVFDSCWDDWLDVLPQHVQNRSKLKVVKAEGLYCAAGTSPSRPPLNKMPVGNTSHEHADEAGSAKLPGNPESSSKKAFTFRNVSHPVLTKLRSGKQLGKGETAELVKKVFHMITEYTFFPTGSDLVSYVRTLLDEFPVLQKDNYKEAKKYWMMRLRKKFSNLQSEVLRRAQRPKVNVSTQTDKADVAGDDSEGKSTGSHESSEEGNPSVVKDMSRLISLLKQEFFMPEPDQKKIEDLMRVTYECRRNSIISMVPKISFIQETYPALFNCGAVRTEFLRITGKQSDKMFHSNLENYGRIIYALTKGCATTHLINRSYEAASNKKVAYDWKIAAVLLLPHLFQENHDFLWFQNRRFDAEQSEPYIKCNAIMKVVAEGGGFFQVYVENILLAETNDLSTAVECFLASFFIFMIEYRTDLKNTLKLLQSFFFEYDDPSEEELGATVVEVAEKLKDRMKQQKTYLKS